MGRSRALLRDMLDVCGDAAIGAGRAGRSAFSSSPAPWPRGELRMRAVERLLRPRRTAWTRLQTAVLRPQRQSRAGAAGVGHVQVRSPHGAQTRGWTWSRAGGQAAVRRSRRIDGSSPAVPQSASCRPAPQHLGLAMPRASRLARIVVRLPRSPSASRVRTFGARPRRSRCRLHAASFQRRSQAPESQARRRCRESVSERDERDEPKRLAASAHTPRSLTGKW